MKKDTIYVLAIPMLAAMVALAAVSVQPGGGGAGSGGSTTNLSPWTGDINAASHSLTNAATVSATTVQIDTTNVASAIAGKQAAGNYITAITGDVTASGPGSAAATITSGAVTSGKLASGAALANIGSQSQNLVLASPNGSSGNMSARALALADIPSTIVSNSTLKATTVFNVKYYGAKGDAVKLTDAVTSSTNLVTSASASFASTDVGKKLWAVNTSGFKVMDITTISSVVSSTSVLVTSNSVAAQSGLSLVYGTDDSDAIRATVAAAVSGPSAGEIYIPSGGYIFSKQPFNLDTLTSSRPYVAIHGAGAGSTFFYPSPAYDNSTRTAGQGTFLTCLNNPQRVEVSDFSVDGSNFPFTWTNDQIISFSSGNNILRNVWVKNFLSPVGSGPFSLASFVGGALILAENCHFEGGNSYAVYCHATATALVGCYLGNSGVSGLYVLNVDGISNGGSYLRIIGCFLDENVSTSCVVQNSTDVTFIGTKVGSYAGSQYALDVDGTSIVKAFGSEFGEWGGLAGNGGGVIVQAGGKFYESGCRVDGFGTQFSFKNAGTVYDLGGNDYRGSVTNSGAGVIIGPSLPSVYFGTNVLSYTGTNLTWNGTAVTVP